MELTPGELVPFVDRGARRRSLISPAARRGIRQRMLLFRQNALDRIVAMTGISVAELHEYRLELRALELPDQLLERGTGSRSRASCPRGPSSICSSAPSGRPSCSRPGSVLAIRPPGSSPRSTPTDPAS